MELYLCSPYVPSWYVQGLLYCYFVLYISINLEFLEPKGPFQASNGTALYFNHCSAIEKICNHRCKSCYSDCTMRPTSRWHSINIHEWKQIKYKLPRTPELFQKMLIIFIRRSMRDYPRHSMQGFTGGWRKQHNARFSWFILFWGGNISTVVWINWKCPVAGARAMRNVHRFWPGNLKAEGKRPLWWYWHKHEDNIKIGLKWVWRECLGR